MTQIDREYGGALFSAAEERGETEEVLEAIRSLQALFEENPNYLAFLSAPNIPKKERVSAVRQALQGHVPATLCSFVQLLCERGYIRAFSGCASEYEALWNEKNGILTALVTSAVPLREEEEARLKARLDKLSGQHVRLSTTVDPSLLGGITVTMDGKFYDGSLKGRMKEIKGVMDR